MIEVVAAAFVGGAVGFVVRGLFGVKASNEIIADDWSTQMQLADAWADNDMRADKLGVLQGRLSDIADYVRDQKSGTARKVMRMVEGER